jgi:hypothetical protein
MKVNEFSNYCLTSFNALPPSFSKVESKTTRVAARFLVYVLLALVTGCGFLYLKAKLAKYKDSPQVSQTPAPQTSDSKRTAPKNIDLVSINKANARIKVQGENAGYDVRLGRSWISFETPTMCGQAANPAKIHISLKREINNMEKATSLLIKIAEKYRLNDFKIGNLTFDTTDPSVSNLLGKECCVYFEYKHIEKIDDILNELADLLVENGIESGRPSKGDLNVPNHDFFYYRNPKNIFKSYMAAMELDVSGFTRIEAAHISKGPFSWDQSCAKNSLSVLLKNVSEIRSAQPRGAYVLEQFQKDLFKRSEEKQIAGIHWLIGGNWKPRGSNYFSPYKKISPHGAKNIYDNYFKPDVSQVQKENLFRGGVFTDESFMNILEDASMQVAHIFTENDIPEDTLPGNILPAIYYGIILPLSTLFSDHENPKEAVAAIKKAIQDRKEEIMKCIVATALRDRTKSHIGSDIPILLI